MGREKVSLLVLMVAVLLLTSCGRDASCIKREDVKLIAAALKRETAKMEDAIKSGADVNATVEGLGPPIVIATLTNNYDGVKLLLDKGANINAEDSDGYTALINASFNNNSDILRLLLLKGVNVNAPSNLMVNGKRAGFTAMTIAKSKGYQEIVRLLTEAGAKE